MSWPTLKATTHGEVLFAINKMAEDCIDLANKTTIYAGGGGTAHRLREAAAKLQSAANDFGGWRDLEPVQQTDSEAVS